MTIRRRDETKTRWLRTAALAAAVAAASTQASAQLQSVGGSDSPFLSCFYECKPGPEIQGEPTYRQVTTLPIVNNSQINQGVQLNFIDGNGNPIATTDIDLLPRDVDELAVCNTIESITGAPPPRAGVIQMSNFGAYLEFQPSGVHAWIKNVNGKFFRERPEPYDGRVTGIAKSECALVASPQVNLPDQILVDRQGLPSGPPILVEDTEDGQPSPPDLLPQRDGNGFLCRINANGDLEVEIRNQGGTTSVPTVAEVRFTSGPGGSQALATPALVPGASSTSTVPIPLGCFAPNCNFEIEADRSNQEAESNEVNNLDTGSCLG